MAIDANRLNAPTPRVAPATASNAGAAARDKAKEKAKEAADGLNQGLGADGVVQDSTRAASLLVERAGMSAKALRVVADFTNGEADAVNGAVGRSTSVARATATRIAPRMVGAVDRTVAPALSGFGKFFSVFSRYAQVLSLPFAALDVRDAIKAKEPKEKRAAIANATLSVSGGVAGAIGGFMYATPIGLPLLVISTTTGLFQIADHFLWHGKGTDWLGEHVVAPIEGLFKH